MYEFTADWFSRAIPNWEILLAHLVDTPAKCVEIGSYEGRSAIWLVENILTHRDASLICYDPWPNEEVERRFDANIRIVNTDRKKIWKCKGNSWETLLADPPGVMVDFVYIDGSHEAKNVLEDAVLAFRMCKPGGIIIFDDYQWTSGNRFHPPKPAIDAFLECWGPWIEQLHVGWQVAVRVKQAAGSGQRAA